jgi:molecular chaperone DnaJ
MVVQAKVETPQHLTRRQRELLEEFEAEASGHAKGSPEHEGFFAKMKEFLSRDS